MTKGKVGVGVVVTVQGGVVVAVDATEPIAGVLVDHDNGGQPEWLTTGVIEWETWGMYAGEADGAYTVMEVAYETKH